MAASVLLLDEANSAMDVSVSYRVFALLKTWAKSHNWAVIAVVHDLNLAQRFADACLLLKQGRLVACGQPSAVLNADNLLATYDIEFCAAKLDYGEVLWLPKLGV
jgi:iron complex transport system ATP-binding protein